MIKKARYKQEKSVLEQVYDTSEEMAYSKSNIIQNIVLSFKFKHYFHQNWNWTSSEKPNGNPSHFFMPNFLIILMSARYPKNWKTIRSKLLQLWKIRYDKAIIVNNNSISTFAITDFCFINMKIWFSIIFKWILINHQNN